MLWGQTVALFGARPKPNDEEGLEIEEYVPVSGRRFSGDGQSGCSIEEVKRDWFGGDIRDSGGRRR